MAHSPGDPSLKNEMRCPIPAAPSFNDQHNRSAGNLLCCI
jgi:hypothetical protein